MDVYLKKKNKQKKNDKLNKKAQSPNSPSFRDVTLELAESTQRILGKILLL